MKYTIMINQVGIENAGLWGKTDLIDWAIIDYIKDWEHFASAKTIQFNGEEYVWINYKHMIESMPGIRIKSKDPLTDRFRKLKMLGLIKSFQSKDNTLYVRLTSLTAEICFFNKKKEDVEEMATAGVTEDGAVE